MKHVGRSSKGCATTWWVLRELPRRTVKLADGPRQEPLVQTAAGGLLQRKPLQTQFVHGSWQECRVWAGTSSLILARCDPLPHCFFLAGPWDEESGRARGAESLSKKKALCKCRDARLISTQWGHSVSVSAVTAWAAPKHEKHLWWSSAAYRGALHKLQLRRGICNNGEKKFLFYCSFERPPDGGRGPWDRSCCRHWAAWEQWISGEISRARGLDPLRRLVNSGKGFEFRRSAKQNLNKCIKKCIFNGLW